jgi:hypothetical protein
MFIAHCIYATYAQAQKDQAYQLNAEIGRLRQELEYKHDNYLSDCNKKIDGLWDEICQNKDKASKDLCDRGNDIVDLVRELEAKITIIQNGLQWQKK